MGKFTVQTTGTQPRYLRNTKRVGFEPSCKFVKAPAYTVKKPIHWPMNLQQQKSNFIPLPSLDTTLAKMVFAFPQMKQSN